MRGIISTSKTELEVINKKINHGMKATVPDYNAVRYGEIIKHLRLEEWVLMVNDDERNPRQFLTSDNKLKHIEVDIANYYLQDV